jgi:hypothetical protein
MIKKKLSPHDWQQNAFMWQQNAFGNNLCGNEKIWSS